MRYWFTAHYPPIKARQDTLNIYVQDKYLSTVRDLRQGDKVFVYEFKHGPGIRELKGGVEVILRHEPGAQGVICEADVLSELQSRQGYVPEQFIGKGLRNFKWQALTGERHLGLIPRQRVNELLGYKPGYSFFGFNGGRGIKEISREQYAALHAELFGS